MNTSFIISTYNRPDALGCVLNSLNNQSNSAFNVIVADDGSSTDTYKVIDAFRLKSKYKLDHVWQEDHGFRAAEIRNKAVAMSEAEYLIFLDGDCLVFPDFIEKHLALAESGYFVRGNRVMLSEKFTRTFIEDKLDMANLSMTDLFRFRVNKKINRLFPLLKIPLGRLRKLKGKDWFGVKTCNLGMWRKDFIEVNGFNEDYVGWGHEDADLAVRLIKNNVRRKEGVYAVTVFHLWHPLNDRAQLSENVRRLKLAKESENIQATRGVSQYR